MKKSTPAPLASVRTRRFIWGTLIFCAANYLAHLFPISLMSTFGWQTDVLHDQNPSLSSARFNQVVAWFEFFIVSFIILVLVEILAVLLVFREGLRLCFGGRDELSIDGSGYLLLFLGRCLQAAYR